MKTIYHSHLRGTNGCLGYYQGLDALLSDFPEGGLPGEFFINGKSKSIWMWDATEKKWYDTNHVSPAPFMGMVIDPTTFSPSLGEEGGCYIYVVGQKGRYEFPRLSGSDAIVVETDSAGIIILVWDGVLWHPEFTPLSFDNTGSPIALFQGEWSATRRYQSGNGFSDVVSYCGDYFRLKSLAKGDSELAPDESDDWELLPHYAAVANELGLSDTGVIFLKGRQQLKCVDNENNGYSLVNGEIVHTGNNIRLNKSGEIHLSIEESKGELIISPMNGSGGLILYSDVNDIRYEILRICENWNGGFLIEGHQEENFYDYQMSVNGFGITITKREMGVSRPTSNIVLSITRDGLKCPLKYIDDNPESGELYYDQDGIVHYCK